MEIVVLNGSPKGELGVTLQYLRFAERKFPGHRFRYLHVAQGIHRLERDEGAFAAVMDAVGKADGVVWAFPLYYMLVCSQYKRFIELVFERGGRGAFAGKYAAAVSTSVHFFDHTAHAYIHGICDDLGMAYVGGYSAAMYDLARRRERERWLTFFDSFLDAARRRAPTARVHPPLPEGAPFTYRPSPPAETLNTGGMRVLVVKDGRPPGGNVDAMVAGLVSYLGGGAEIFDLAQIDIKGGCLGCCRCGLDNTCQYLGRDGYIDFYEHKVKQADALVLAGAVHDRYLSARWKAFFDRSFYNTHVPTLTGKRLAYLVSGPLGHLPNLREILSAYAEFEEVNPVGFVTDEAQDGEVIDALLGETARRLVDPRTAAYRPPMTFLGVGGHKIFRDEIYGDLRFVFQADHRYYVKNRLYDFPQGRYRTRMRNLVMMTLLRIPAFRRRFLKEIKKKMVEPLQRIAETK